MSRLLIVFVGLLMSADFSICSSAIPMHGKFLGFDSTYVYISFNEKKYLIKKKGLLPNTVKQLTTPNKEGVVHALIPMENIRIEKKKSKNLSI